MLYLSIKDIFGKK